MKLPLTSCCAAQFLTGHSPVVVRSPGGLGPPALHYYLLISLNFPFNREDALRVSDQPKESQEIENGKETRSFRFTNLKKAKVPLMMQMK